MMEDDEISVPSSSSSRGPSTSGSSAVTARGTFDLDAYIQNYSGHTKIRRLIYIAEHCPELAAEATKQALDELKGTANTALYRDLAERSGTKPDQAWIDSTERKSVQQLERLELDLNTHKSNMDKEAIRLGHVELGDFHYNRGDLSSALKCYARMRDYCTSSTVIGMCLSVIKVGIEMNNYSHVQNYVAKAEQTPNASDHGISARLQVASGLSLLEGRKYKMAARKFLETPFEPAAITAWNDVIAPQDIATYGALMALASFDRQELKKKVLDNAVFRNYLELTPELRELLNDFYDSKYTSMLRHLENIRSDVQLDLHLGPHVSSLYEKIRSKALIQYFTPFSSVDLNTMATSFNTTPSLLEKELAKLITEGSIQARIDSHNKRLYARQTDDRSSTFEAALRAGDEYQRNTLALLQRVSLMKNDMVVKQLRRDDKDK
eukprot:TRINITY_DN2124_c0_g1_i1.p1 TRINITY_DN2124_c0_g1~~TRINITY_DN2124_c0_g1_i1.p1  ORF type:complete len:436 (+),score=129.42 TRINITY_DN2124_c0_g1_i1:32-1339(+)